MKVDYSEFNRLESEVGYLKDLFGHLLAELGYEVVYDEDSEFGQGKGRINRIYGQPPLKLVKVNRG